MHNRNFSWRSIGFTSYTARMSASQNEKEREYIYAPCSKRQRLCDYSPELLSSSSARTISDASGSPIFLSDSTECETSASDAIDPSYFSKEECGDDSELNPANSRNESEAESQASSIDAIYPSDISDLYENNSEDGGADANVFHCFDTTATPNSQKETMNYMKLVRC